MMKERFLEPLLAVEAGDRLLLAPVFSVDVEIYERGLLRRPSYRRVRLWVDGLTGRELAPLREPTPSCLPLDGRSVPPRLSEAKALFVAEGSRCGALEGWRGWGRYASVQVLPQSLSMDWRYLIRRGDRLLDGLTGDDHELGILAPFLESGF